MERKKVAIAAGLLAGVSAGSFAVLRRRRRNLRAKGLPATFTGDVRGGGTAGVIIGRGGASTPMGDIAGGGEPGSHVDFGGGTVTTGDALPTGGAGTATGGRRRARGAELPAPASALPRTSTAMAPGIPEGSGRGIDQALERPDSELGGAIAGDTTVGQGRSESARDPEQVRRDDKERTTL